MHWHNAHTACSECISIALCNHTMIMHNENASIAHSTYMVGLS